MNIMFTNYCNLDCEYCFAYNSMDKKNNKELSFENFKYYIKYIKKNNIQKLNIIGGEPTLHSKFFDYLEYQIDNNNVINEILIFTNQTFNEKFQIKLNALQKKQESKKITIGILINYNDNVHKIIDKNIQSLFFNSNIEISLGMNIFNYKNQDFTNYFNQIKKFKIEEQRWTIVMPKNYNEIDKIEYYKKFNPQLKRFLIGLKKSGVKKLPQDCTTIPYCQLDKDLQSNYKYLYKCSPILDVDINLNIIRCFMFPEFNIKLDINKKPEYYFNYFIEKIDKKYKNYSCKKCDFFKNNGTDCGCIQWNKKYIGDE